MVQCLITAAGQLFLLVNFNPDDGYSDRNKIDFYSITEVVETSNGVDILTDKETFNVDSSYGYVTKSMSMCETYYENRDKHKD
jgi:hypothetical protein